MATPYEPPAWGVDGKNIFGISLDVIRNGSLVETVSLPLDPAKSYVVAGRMEPVCDLVLQHPSLSRVHAVLQFDSHGALFVQDMKSTHGTFVNKKRLVPLEFQRVHVGDLIVFGESTRKYAVCGPDELRPEEADMTKVRAKLKAKKEAQKRRDENEARGATWGFREDAEEEEDESEEIEDKTGKKHDDDLPSYLRGLKEPGRSSYESSIIASDVNEKDHKLFTQLQNKIHKMKNLETENARILVKQNDLQGLSEGQQKTLDRNTARIESLTTEIADLEDRIHARNAERDQSRAKNRAREQGRSKPSTLYAYDSDEDDFYDRTSANQKKLNERKQQLEHQAIKVVSSKKAPPKNEVLTAEIIERKIQMLEKDLEGLRAEYARVEAEGDADKSDGQELDALEAFMQSTAKELHAKELARVRTRRHEVETELTKQRQLLMIAMPALRQEQPASSSSKPDAQPVEPEAKPEMAEPTTESVSRATTVSEIEAPKKTEFPPKESQKTEQQKCTDVDPVVEKHVPVKKRRVVGPTLPPPTAKSTISVEGAVLEGGDRVWVPPANQTGDGRTKLNDKYGY